MENHTGENLAQILAQRGVSRRDFLKFCTVMAGTLALPASVAPRIARALETTQRPPIVWLEFQDCAGCSESLLRANQPTVAQLVLDTLSLNYHETIMTPSGAAAEKSLEDTVQAGGYLTIVEGSIPQNENGIYCCIAGRTALDIVKEVAGNSAAVIAVGACAVFGGWPSAAPNPTGAVGAQNVLSGVPIINMAGCPYNVDNLTAAIVHYLTFGSLPDVDSQGRPLFGYGRRIHDNCERRAHFDAGEFVKAWGDEGHRNGWCLYQMGCKGPISHQNCPTIRWNEGTNWPVRAGHGCIACAENAFWDIPHYQTIPIFEQTPPTTFPSVEQGGQGLSPAAAGGIGAAGGLAVGVAGAIAVRELTKES
jgi:hydrogenase small subunit